MIEEILKLAARNFMEAFEKRCRAQQLTISLWACRQPLDYDQLDSQRKGILDGAILDAFGDAISQWREAISEREVLLEVLEATKKELAEKIVEIAALVATKKTEPGGEKAVETP
jgi:hypothetical protein